MTEPFCFHKKFTGCGGINHQPEMHSTDISLPENRVTPLVPLEGAVFRCAKVKVWVKRDDLTDFWISGNKWRKLKYNLEAARRRNCRRLITFGGAFSNHLAAVAAAGKLFGFSTIGVVRGERVLPLNPTLQFAEECGMEIFYVSRTKVREFSETQILSDLKISTHEGYILPAGGSNCLALPGCAEIAAETETQLGEPPDFYVCACGTGGTLAGLINAGPKRGRMIGIPVLKGNFLKNQIHQLLAECSLSDSHADWRLIDGYHFGGYARFQPGLIAFIRDFKTEFGIPLDPVYTGKAFFAAVDLIGRGFFPEGSKIVLLHTGGLQGIAGFNLRFERWKILLD